MASHRGLTALVDCGKVDQVNAGTRTADLLHLAAEIDRAIRLGRLERRRRAAVLGNHQTTLAVA